MGSLGVLYTDSMFSEDYHLMYNSGRKAEHYRYALKTDRTRASTVDTYTHLLDVCKRLDVNRVWVHPDTDLSIWVNRTDFENLPKSLHSWVAKEGVSIHPIGATLQRVNEPQVFIFFPQYMRVKRNHKKDSITPDWNIPAHDHLYNTVSYLGIATQTPFIWSAAHSSRKLLTRIHEKNHIDVYPFLPYNVTRWEDAHKHMIARPLWSIRRRDGKQGLLEYMLQFKYVVGLDKNMQYLGACVNNKLPKGPYVEVSGKAFNGQTPGFWEYEILDVSQSMFNSYECFCPLKIRGSWATTQLLNVALKSGMKLDIKRGLAYPQENMYTSDVLREWANILWSGRQALLNEYTFTDRLAASNAMETMKLFYIDFIGQLNNEYSGAYYHPDWNMFVIHQAIASQAWTFLVREEMLKGKIVLVANDAFYLLSNENTVEAAYPDLLRRWNTLAGYKPVGVAPLNDEIIHAFETMRPLDIESTIKRNMIKNGL